jgi:hypothetical protein
MVKIGDIFVAEWGYDQTNATFFQVVGVTPKGLKVRQIKSKENMDGQSMTGTAIPIKNSFTGETKTKRLTSWNGVEAFRGDDSYGLVEKWDGKPVGVSCYA